MVQAAGPNDLERKEVETKGATMGDKSAAILGTVYDEDEPGEDEIMLPTVSNETLKVYSIACICPHLL